jgi:predicted DNA-binding transcriptional regulator AlpA
MSVIVAESAELLALIERANAPLREQIAALERRVSPDPGRLLTLAEAAARVGFSTKTVMRWIHDGRCTTLPNGRPGQLEKLARYPLTDTDIRIRQSDLDAFVEKFRQQ